MITCIQHLGILRTVPTAASGSQTASARLAQTDFLEGLIDLWT